MWTLCAPAGTAVTVPEATTLAKLPSVATCHSTSTLVAGMPPRPSGFSGAGASLVHSTNPSVVGSPEATPSWNGSCGSEGVSWALTPAGWLSDTARCGPPPPATRGNAMAAPAVRPAAAAPPRMKLRRSSLLIAAYPSLRRSR